MDFREIEALPGDRITIYFTDGDVRRGRYEGTSETINAKCWSEEWYSGVEEYVNIIMFHDERTQFHMSAKEYEVSRVEILEKGKDHDRIKARLARRKEERRETPL